jgi:hypothetical protein
MTDETTTAQETERRLAELEADVVRLRAAVDGILNAFKKLHEEWNEETRAELARPFPPRRY